MKAAFVVILSMLLSIAVFAQNGWTRKERQAFKEADFAFYQQDYATAFPVLSELYKVDSTYAPVSFELGVMLLDWKKDKVRALNLLGFAAEAGMAESWYHYGRALHANMKFMQAKKWFNKSLSVENSETPYESIKRGIEMTDRAIEAIAHPVDVNITNLGPGVNTKAREYVPIVTPDNQKLYFTSRRNDSTARLKDPNDDYYEDIYLAMSDSGQWGQVINLGQPINSETHDATVSISADGKTLILYRTNENLTGGDLYISQWKNGTWTRPVKLPAQINSEFQEASATLSPDKKTLVFSSNRPGGFGGKDLYRVRMLPNGQWSLPRNLGPSVNTPFDEDAPHFDIDGRTLYFASKGHSTIGGFDLFRTQLIDAEEWDLPENLGYPVNTVDDDIFLTVDAGGRRGYFSSIRPGGFGQDDLYSIDFVYRQQQLIVLLSEVLTVEGVPINAKVTVIDENSRQVHGIYRTNAGSGKFILVLNPLTHYKLLVEAEGYLMMTDDIFLDFPESLEETEVTLAPYMLSK